ncbi:hypothetical protein SeMB42_g01710 [Synchytrium endobioticum]|nr:hypothetical protein SeMB42_g01710 [Synchytrium endobioticum]
MHARSSRQDSARYLDDGSSSVEKARPKSKWEQAADKASERPFQRNADALYDEDEDGETLQTRTRDIQQSSLQSSRRALTRMKETELLAQSNMTKVAAQGEQLNSIERKMDLADQRALEADANTNELKKLNRPFFLPTWGAKAAKNQAGITQRDAQRQDRDRARDVENESRSERLQRVMDVPLSSRHGSSYTTPTGLERDETEEEIDSNLNALSGGLSRLKMMAASMNEELDGQNGSFHRITDQAEKVKARVDSTQKKVQRFLPKSQRSK